MAAPRLRLVPLELIDEPENPARTGMDQKQLESLAQSIRDVGLLEPLVVHPAADGRFRVMAGHRRLLACRLAPLTQVPCVVRSQDGDADAVKIHENIEREELSPVDEGRYYLALYHGGGEDLEAVARQVKKSVYYVDRRIQLVINDQAVMQALHDKRLSLSVAEELLRIRDPDERAYYLEYAVRGGCSARMARQWRAEANARTELRERQTGAAGTTEAAAAAPAPEAEPGSRYLHTAAPYELSSSKELRPCLFCGDSHEEWRMYRKFVCGACADRELAPLPVRGGGDGR